MSLAASRVADRIVLVGLILVTAATWLPRLHGPIDVRWDSGVYYTLGMSLAEGKGYRLPSEPGDVLAVQYPPGLPLLIAAHDKIVGATDYVVVGRWLRITYLLLSLAYTATVYLVARDYLSMVWAALAAGLFVIAYQTLFYSQLVQTELPFGLLVVLFVLCIRRAEKPGWGVCAGIVAAAAFAVRTTGVALLAIWVLESCRRGRFKTALARAGTSAALFLAWQGYIHHVTSSAEYHHPTYAYQRADYQNANVSYSQNLRLRDSWAPERGLATRGDVVRRVLKNIVLMPGVIGYAASTPYSFWAWPVRRLNAAIGQNVIPIRLVHLPIIFFGCMALVGLVVLAIGGEWLVVLLTAMLLGLITLTPWVDQFPRYAGPAIPLLLVALAAGLAWAWKKSATNRGALRWVGPALLIATVGPAVFADGVMAAQAMDGGLTRVSYVDAKGNRSTGTLLFYTAPWQALDGALAWVRQHAAPDDVVATTIRQTAFLRTRLRTVLPPLEASRANELQMLDSVPVKFVVTDDWDICQRYLEPAVKSRPDLWREVFVCGKQDPGDPSPSVSRVYERVGVR